MRTVVVGVRGVDVLFCNLGQDMGGFLFLKGKGDFGGFGWRQKREGDECGFEGKEEEEEEELSSWFDGMLRG